MTTETRAEEAKASGAARHGVVRRARACLAAALLAVLGATAVSDCAQMSAGDCADKAACVETDGGPGPSGGDAGNVVDASVGPDARDEATGATPPEGGGDGTAEGATVDATTDSQESGASDATNDARDQLAPGADADAGADAPGTRDVTVPPAEAGPEGGPDAQEGGPDAACPAPPIGWSSVLLEDTGGAGACPAGWTAHDGVSQPAFGAGACTCSCGVTQTPDCNTGTLTPQMGGTSTTCTQPWFSVAVQGTGCSPIAGGPITTLPANVATSPLPAAGGACNGTLQTDPTQVSTTAVRYCDTPSGGASACDPVGSGFSACIVSPGAVACPAGTPFVNAHVVAAQVSLACSACSACGVTGTCINAAFTTYRDGACTGNLIGFTANNTCSGIGLPFGPGTTIGAVAYRATLSQSSCTPGASTPSAQLTGAVTVCCP